MSCFKIKVDVFGELEIGWDMDEDNELELTVTNNGISSSVWIDKGQIKDIIKHLTDIL